MTPTRREVLGAGALAALAGCLGLGGGDGPATTGTPSATPDGPVATASLPADPASHTYATMGTDGPSVTYFGNWKCPFCAQFSTGLLPDLVEEFVAPGSVSLRFRALSYTGSGEPFLGPDAPRAARAGLAVWTVDPASYWPFHEQVMANQPPESEQWATVDRLVEFAWQAGVDDLETVRSRIEDGSYDDAVRSNTSAAVDANVSGTPALVVDGTTVNPVADPERTRSLLADAAGGT